MMLSDGNFYSPDGKTLLRYTGNDESYAIEEGVTDIGANAFINYKGNSITIPNSVTHIDNYAFLRCSATIEWGDDPSITNIGEDAFRAYLGKNITIPNSVTVIEKMAFYECIYLTSINFPDSVTSIGIEAFGNCSNLTSAIIGNNISSISWGAFYDCPQLTIFCDAASKPSGWHANWNRRDYETRPVYWAGQWMILSDGNFYSPDGKTLLRYTGNDTNYVIAEGVTSIGKNAFRGCLSLVEITVPNGVVSIGDNAFMDCSKLASIDISSSMTSIGEAAFSRCSSLARIVIPSNVTVIKNYAFTGCLYLEIFCESNSKPTNWNSDWNYDYCSVYWGGSWSLIEGVPTPNEP